MAKLVLAAAVLALLTDFPAASTRYGGPVDVDVNNQGVKDALSFAMYDYNKRSNDRFTARPVEVMQAQRQLVNGYVYDLVVQVGRTHCNNPTTNPNDCKFHTAPNLAKTVLCKFKVYSCPWKSKVEMQGSDCS